MSQQNTTIALGTEDVGKLLTRYAWPAIVAMTASSLFNITDSIFIGHGVGPLAISGLAITFPLMNLAAAFGSLVGIGASTLMSVRLGQKDYETANKVLGNVFVLNIILGLAFSVVTLAFLDPILMFFGASAETLPYAREYMTVILAGNVITHMYLGLNALLRSSGNPKKAMFATIFAVIINLILNPLFIFTFKMGIKGSALATIISQILMLAWQISIFSNKKNFVHLKKGVFRLERKIVLDSMAIGLSPFFINAASSLLVIIINQSLSKYGGDLSVGAYGIVNRVVFLFGMVVMGFNQGMQPIAGYNYGALQFKRVDAVFRKTIVLSTIVLAAGFVTGQFFPHAVASMFTTDAELTERAVKGLRMVTLFFPLLGVQFVTVQLFQSIGMAKKSIFLSMTRQLLFFLPCVLIFPSIWGANGVWYSFPAADIASAIVSTIFLVKLLRQFKNEVEPEFE
jgi:putative MATE family efflux protein